jgi:outer membrane protein TolC
MLVCLFSVSQPAYAKLVSSLSEDSTSSAAADSTASTANQGSTTVTATLTGEKKSISLNEAMELALANSSDVLEAANNMADAKVDWDKAADQAKSYYKLLGRPDYSRLNQDYYALIVLTPALMEKTYDIYVYTDELQQSAAKLKAIQGYYTVVCNGKSEVASLYSYQKAQNQYSTVKARYNQGMATKLELLSAQAQVNGAKVALDAARATTVQSKRSLSILMGLDPETNWSPTTQLTYDPLKIADADAKAKEMMEASPAVGIAKAQFEIATLQHDYEAGFNASFTYDGQIAEISYDTAKVQYQNAQNTAYTNAKAMLENLSLAKSQYDVYQESQTLLEEVYRLSVLQYENGLNTQNDVQSAAADIVSNDASRLQALLNYNVLKTTIEQGIVSTQ